MKRISLTLGLAAALVVGASGVARADAAADCGAQQAKAYVKLYKQILKEAAKACGQGAVGNPAAVSYHKAAKAAGSFDSIVGKSMDQHGAANCALDFGDTTTSNVLESMQDIANQACLVP